jgi:hypothetical protein
MNDISWPYRTHLDPEALPDEWVWERLRLRRDSLLAASDWTQVADAPVDKEAWAVYRQALRDLPESVKDPRQAVWPESPQ